MELTVALSSAMKGYELVKLAIDAKNEAQVRAAVSDMAKSLMEANLAALDLTTKLANSEAKLREFEKSAAEREQYQLHEIAKGRFVYIHTGSPDNPKAISSPTHYLCQNCFDKGVKSVLRFEDGGSDWSDKYICAEVEQHSIWI